MRLTQHDVAACREAFSQYDGDAARLRAMLAAAHQDAPDDVVLDLCSQVALQRPLHAVAETASPAGSAGAAAGAGDAASGSASFEMLLRVVEQQARSEEDAEEDSLLAFVALGGGSDKTGFVSSDRMKAVCKVRALAPACGAAARCSASAARSRGTQRARVDPHQCAVVCALRCAAAAATLPARCIAVCAAWHTTRGDSVSRRARCDTAPGALCTLTLCCAAGLWPAG